MPLERWFPHQQGLWSAVYLFGLNQHPVESGRVQSSYSANLCKRYKMDSTTGTDKYKIIVKVMLLSKSNPYRIVSQPANGRELAVGAF